MDEQSVTVIPLQMAMSIVVLLQLRWKRVVSSGTLSENPMRSQNLLIIFPGVFCWPDEFNGGGFKAIVIDDYLVMLEAPFNHDGRTSPSVGAVCPVDVVIREDETMAGLEVSFLKVYNVRVPVCDKTPEFFNFRSNSVGIPRDYCQIGSISFEGIKS
ncbi:hypothetical protein TNCV_4824141 [Trichonephila clavipes]|nr:hypothetical protein TNCV_4824141 [Trichonephila clavipes]